MKTGFLGYNYDNNRYGRLNKMDLWEDSGLHCGECLEVFVNDKLVQDRIELKYPDTWYLVKTKLEGNQLEGLKVRME